MFLFIVSFIVFTFTNTFFHNIQILVLSFVLCFIVLTTFLIFKYKNKIFKHAKYFLILVGSFVFSISAIVIKDWRYDEGLGKDFFETKIASHTLAMTGSLSYYIGSGIIVDTYSYGKYIFQDELGDEYILNTDQNYQIGDNLRLVGYQKNVELDQRFSGFSLSFDYNKWLIMKGYMGNIYEGNGLVISCHSEEGNNEGYNYILRGCSEGQNKIGFIPNIKRSLQSRITSTYGENRNAGLILGMLVGDKSQIPKSDYQKFIDSGLVHLIAVSGGNIIMLIVFLSFILFFLPFYLKNFIILLIIILYSFVCGMDSSVMRAVAFAGLCMMALFVGREVNFRRSVYVVFLAMLLINPYFLLYDLGFLLSFGAVMGIRILTNNGLKNNKKSLDSSLCSEGQTYIISILKKLYNAYIKPSIGANIGIFPIIIFFMGEINLIGFIINLFVLPIVPFVMIYGFVSIFIYSLIPWNGRLYIQEILINYIYTLSQIGSNYGIYLSVSDYKIKYLILILFVIGLIIYLYKNKIIYSNSSDYKNRAKTSIKHKTKKSNRPTKKQNVL